MGAQWQFTVVVRNDSAQYESAAILQTCTVHFGTEVIRSSSMQC